MGGFIRCLFQVVACHIVKFCCLTMAQENACFIDFGTFMILYVRFHLPWALLETLLE